ncbi:MAG TPA: hypothetical protein VJT73_01265 [Polyangiaceae bacterium]|nr:hypothetical protein [Polyangiaceae bacterium]
MRGRQLTQWFWVVSLAACTPDPDRYSVFPTFSEPEGGGSLGIAGMGAGGASRLAGDGGQGGPRATDGAVARDAANDRDTVVVHMEGGVTVACPNDRATLGSNELRAGGATPTAFANAYNLELDALQTAGPMLLTLSGVNAGSSATKTASFGALEASGRGAGFDGSPATAPFELDGARRVRIAPRVAAFGLRFVPPASAAIIPAGSIELTGTLANACTSLVIAKLALLVPASAGAVAFHGSTVAALMGPTTATIERANDAWPLELTGKAQQVLSSIGIDGGAER